MEQSEQNLQERNKEDSNLSPTSNGMNQKTIVLTVTFFVLIVAGMFIFAYLRQGEIEETRTQNSPQADQTVNRYANITRVDGKHFYIDGVHTIVGEIPMPTPCDLLESSVSIAESFPEQIFIDFTVVNNVEFCAQVVTPQRFKISATASEEATFSARFQGRPIELNLTPAEQGETPDVFEIFIKG